MPTTRLPTVCLTMSWITCTVRSKLNKFEHIHGDTDRALHRGIPYVVRSNVSWVMITRDPPLMDRMTDKHD